MLAIVRSLALLGLLLVIGCAGRATRVDGMGGASSVSGGATGVDDADAGSAKLDAGSDASCPPLLCPSPFVGIRLVVSTFEGGPVSEVRATLSGPITVKLSCTPEADGTFCSPTDGGPEGSYSLEVTAPEFQPVDVAATVTFAHPACGCGGATLQPSAVIIYPMRL
jgi:hypothetical protein